MKLKLENLDVTSFATTQVPAAVQVASNTGEDCWSFRVCFPKPFTIPA